jgi:tetratricopeptide (TPR) repeat protein
MKGRMFVVFLLLISSAAAQIGASNLIPRVRVRLALENGICDAWVDVALVGHNGAVGQSAPNDRCEVDFFNVPEGDYHVKVSGGNFTNADSGSVNMTAAGQNEFEIQVKSRNELDRNFGGPASAFVSASDLGIPGRARKELDKASELADKQQLAQAVQKLNKAISIYPSYALAYNNLGVLYARLGDSVREREALQKAISLNDHFVLPYINLGRMHMAAGDFPATETALGKAFTLDPADPMTLILLSYSQFMDRRFDEAIATSHKAHAVGKPHAFVHRVAARAFEQQRQGASAIAELELFLKEEPRGPRADAARKELEVVKAVLPANPAETKSSEQK